MDIFEWLRFSYNPKLSRPIRITVSLAGAAELKGRTEPIKMYKVSGYITKTGDHLEVSTPYSEYLAENSDKIKKVS